MVAEGARERRSKRRMREQRAEAGRASGQSRRGETNGEVNVSSSFKSQPEKPHTRAEVAREARRTPLRLQTAFQEPQIERREDQDNSDVHYQPLSELVPEEQDVHADHNGYQREHVKHDCLSSHRFVLLCAAEWGKGDSQRCWSAPSSGSEPFRCLERSHGPGRL